MAKVTKRIAPPTDTELRRWCIEQAIRWPVFTSLSYGTAVGQANPQYGQDEADILDRARRIYDWVTSAK